MPTDNVYAKLAEHLSRLGMGYPVREDLVDILKEVFSSLEAEVALAIPNTPIPLEPVSVDEILKGTNLDRGPLVEILEGLDQRGLVYSARMSDGEKGYALHQVQANL